MPTLPVTVLVFLVSQLLFGSVLQAKLGNSCWGRYPCQLEKHNRTTLYCLDSCKDKTQIDFREQGCQVCKSEPYWMCSGQYHRSVDIEYFTRGGIGKAAYVDNNHQFNISMLRHTAGWLSEIPGNICDIFDLVKIDLQKNRINVLKQLACLKVLDTLILSHNLISYISNDTFLNMPELRVLDLSNNLIEYLEPNSLTGPGIGIMRMDFDNNILRTIDVTNIVLEHSFCTLSYSENQIFEIVNDVGWKINKTKNYGYGGYVDLSTNVFQSWPDFTIFGLDNLSDLHKIFGFGLDFRNVNFSCDCKMTSFLKLTEEAIRKIWRDYYNVTCSNPESLKGQSIPQLVMDKQLDLFVCDIPRGNAGGCPEDCKCFDLTSQNATVVNCSNTNKTSLPDRLPRNRTNFVLDFSRNEIKYLESKTYFASTVNLTLESNSIGEINFNTFQDAEKMTLLTLNDNNGISSLPKSLQRLDPCQISLGALILRCHCDILWIADWANSPKSLICEGQNNISCKTSGGEILPMASWTRENFECPNESQLTIYMYVAVVLAVLSFVVGFIAHLVYRFKYEIYLTIRRITQKKEVDRSDFKYDVYISFNDNNRTITSWIRDVLEFDLNFSGYNVFLPCRDLPIGMPKVEAISEHLHQCQRFLFLIDHELFHDEEAILRLQEWRCAWQICQGDSRRRLAVVNYDHLRSKDISEDKITAFLNVGLAIDFSNRDGNIFDNIKDRLGFPLPPQKRKTIHCFCKKAFKRWLYPSYSDSHPFDMPRPVLDSSKPKFKTPGLHYTNPFERKNGHYNG